MPMWFILVRNAIGFHKIRKKCHVFLVAFASSSFYITIEIYLPNNHYKGNNVYDHRCSSFQS